MHSNASCSIRSPSACWWRTRLSVIRDIFVCLFLFDCFLLLGIFQLFPDILATLLGAIEGEGQICYLKLSKRLWSCMSEFLFFFLPSYLILFTLQFVLFFLGQARDVPRRQIFVIQQVCNWITLILQHLLVSLDIVFFFGLLLIIRLHNSFNAALSILIIGSATLLERRDLGYLIFMIS